MAEDPGSELESEKDYGDLGSVLQMGESITLLILKGEILMQP